MKLTNSQKLVVVGGLSIPVYFMMLDFFKTQIIYDLVVESDATFTLILLCVLWGPITDKLAPHIWKENVRRNSWIMFWIGIAVFVVVCIIYLGMGLFT